VSGESQGKNPRVRKEKSISRGAEDCKKRRYEGEGRRGVIRQNTLRGGEGARLSVEKLSPGGERRGKGTKGQERVKRRGPKKKYKVSAAATM